MSFFYKISIDRVNANYISGWCFHRFNKLRKVELELYLDDSLIGETTAGHLREDLCELGIHPNGECGFEFVTSGKIDQTVCHRLTLRTKGSNCCLVQINTDGFEIKEREWFTDIFRSLFVFVRNEKPIMVFMHIPKTAGTSFNTLVHTFLSKGRIVSHLELVEKRKYNRLQGRYNFLSGHLRIGVLKEYFNLEEADLYTIVREPYSHLHSHLKWLIKTSTDSNDSYFKHSNRTIYDLGRSLSHIDFGKIDDLAQFTSDIKGTEAAFFDNMQTRYFLDHEPGRVCDNDFEQAVANTELFRLIGLTEDYFSFVNRFVQINGLKKSGLSKKLNLSKTEPLFDYNDQVVREILYPLVRFDLELYDHIRRLQHSC